MLFLRCEFCGEIEKNCICVVCSDCGYLASNCQCNYCDYCGYAEYECSCDNVSPYNTTVKSARFGPKEIDKTSFSARLHGAFAELRLDWDFLCCHNFWCCGSCASTGFGPYQDKEYVGGVYYHQQDLEYFMDSGEMLLGHGSLNGSFDGQFILDILLYVLDKNDLNPVCENNNPNYRVKISD